MCIIHITYTLLQYFRPYELKYPCTNAMIDIWIKLLKHKHKYSSSCSSNKNKIEIKVRKTKTNKCYTKYRYTTRDTKKNWYKWSKNEKWNRKEIQYLNANFQFHTHEFFFPKERHFHCFKRKAATTNTI